MRDVFSSCPSVFLMPNAAGERRPTRDDAAEAEKSLLSGPSAPVAGSAGPSPHCLRQWFDDDTATLNHLHV
jgi:hypothetical protein